MKDLKIHISVSDALYIKNPETSELGKIIVTKSIELINDLGFEAFTFKKLGIAIHSPESSIYRYFSNKHMLLIYLLAWYWKWIEYQIVFETTNIDSAEDRLRKALKILTQTTQVDNSISHINESLLCQIIITESMKAYHTKAVDEENKKGYFTTYKQVVERVSAMVLAVQPNFEYPHMLISTVIEGVHQQKYFAAHLPSLTDVKKEDNYITIFYTNMVLSTLKNK